MTVRTTHSSQKQHLKELAEEINDLPIDNLQTTGTPDGTKFLRDDGAWSAGGGAPEGTAVKSTGETGGSKFLREDGDNTCSWQALAGGGDMVAANNLSDLVNDATARTNLDVDQAGTDNSTDVTLAGTGTYLSLIGQAITVDPITESDISDLQTYAVSGGAFHDGFSDYDANEHADITGTASVTGDWTFNANGTGGLSDFDITIGGAAYAMIDFGAGALGRTSYNVASLDLDGSLLLWNQTPPGTSNIEFAFADGSNAVRFALAKAGVGNATYNPRSMLIAGPAALDDTIVTVGYWQGQGIFDNLVCDTDTDGADLGVQNDLEVEGDIFVDSILESTAAAGVTIDGLLVKDSGIPEAAVTAHQAALAVTKSQISDFTETDYATGAEGDLATTALQDKADVEGVLTGEISSHTHAGGGGGEPTENIILTATKTSGQNINGVETTETDLTWDVVSQDTGELTSFTTGDSQATFTNAGWVNIHASAYISNSLMNNRFMMSLSIYHYNSGDTLQYSYHGDMQYNRDDNAAYDASGGSVSQNMMKVAAGDYIILRTRVFDDGTSGTSQTLDTTYSKLRIARIEF